MAWLHQKNKLVFALVCIGVYVVTFSAADALSVQFGIQKAVTAPWGLVLSAALLVWLRREGLFQTYGLCTPSGGAGRYLWYLPLVVLLSANLWNGVQWNMTKVETLLYIVSMLCVGFLEEVIFRGFLFAAMRADNEIAAVAVSSVTFGIGHIVNLLNGAPLGATLLQIVYAAAVGFLFTVLFMRSGSLLLPIAVHGVFNALSAFSVPASQAGDVLTAVALTVISVGYAVWLWTRERAEKSTEKAG